MFRVCDFDWLAHPPCDVDAGVAKLRAALARLFAGITAAR